jgi:hypothetical protein
MGRHDDLMAEAGFYSRMYQWQEIEAEFGLENSGK